MTVFDKFARANHYAGGMTMKKTMKRSRLITTMLALCILFVCMAFAAEPAMAAATPTYIASIGISQDGSSGSTGINDCKSELSGHIIIDRDLNDGAGGDYVYMGFKTTTDPSEAIRGIVFRVGGNPPDSITYNGYTFYLVGGKYETNTAKLGGYIDLNGRAGGVYIYTYVTRDAGYGTALTSMTVSGSTTKSGYITGTNTSGSLMNLNQEAGGGALYLHYKLFSAEVNATYTYLTSAGERTVSVQSATLKTHTDTMTKTPSYSTSVKYDGRNFTFKGWREENTAAAPTTTAPSVSYKDETKYYYAVYSGDLTLSYNANGGSGAPSAKKATQYINAGTSSSSVVKQKKSFTISSTKPTNANKCAFLGWSTSSSDKSASYAPGSSISIDSDEILYAVWKNHSYTDNVCTACGKINSAVTPVATLTKNGKLVGAYATLDEAITAAEKCTAADKAVVQLQKDIALGDAYQDIEGGVFTLDLNGYTISCTSESRYALGLQNTGTNVVITSSRKGGTILSAYYGINASSDTALTVSDVAIIAEESGIMLGTSASISNVSIDAGVMGIWARNSSTVTVTDCTIEAGMFALYIESKVTATVTGGSYTGGDKEEDIYVTGKATVSSAAFPGGIAVDGKPLSAILAAGQAYWAGDTMIVPAADQKAIAGRGDITVKAACTHAGGTKQDYVNNGDDHAYAYSCCGAIYTEAHAYSAVNGLCPCGAINPDAAVIITKNDAVFGAYTTLDAAITAAEGSTADDNAVAQLQKDIDLGDGYQDIDSGVFTIDLNGCAISSTSSNYGALCINSTDANVTIQDSGEGGRIAAERIGIKMKAGTLTVLSGDINSNTSGVRAENSTVTIHGGDINSNNYGMWVENCTVTIRGGAVSGDSYGVFAPNYSSTVTISGGTVTGDTYSVYAESSSTVTISGGTVTGGSGVYAENSTATISGGSVSGDSYGVYAHSSTVTISGGTVSGGKYSMYARISSDVTISGGSVSGEGEGVYARSSSTVTISGGSISGADTDIYNDDATITLTMGENGEGPSFPGGVELERVTLNEILGEGAAYWAGDRMIVLSDGQTEITGMGDITVKAECKHEGGTKQDYIDNGDDHGFTYSCCGASYTEAHAYRAENGLCPCGHINPEATVMVEGAQNAWFVKFTDALAAWTDGTTMKLLEDVTYSNPITIPAGESRTLDLNGQTWTSEMAYINSQVSILLNNQGSLTITDTDSEKTGTIIQTKSGTHIVSSSGSLTIQGGRLQTSGNPVSLSGGTAVFSGGEIVCTDGRAVGLTNASLTVSGTAWVEGTYTSVNLNNNASLNVTGGTIRSEGDTVIVNANASAVISGGTISGKYGVFCEGKITLSAPASITGSIADFHFHNNYPNGRIIADFDMSGVEKPYVVEMDTPREFAVKTERGTLSLQAFTEAEHNKSRNDKIVATESGLAMIPCRHEAGFDENGACLGCGRLIELPLLVEDARVTSVNYSDVLGDGTVRFDFATQTLYLNNAHIEGDLSQGSYGIVCNDSDEEMPLKIHLTGENTVSCKGFIGILSEYDCIITGDGSLTVTGTGAGLVAFSDMIISAQVSASVVDALEEICLGVRTEGDLTVTKDGSLTVQTVLAECEINTSVFCETGAVSNYGTIILTGDVQTIMANGTGVCGADAVSPLKDGVCLICGGSHDASSDVSMVTLPAALQVIKEEAFLGTVMQYVQVPEGTLRIEERAFAGSDLRIIRLPDSIEFIADNAFDGCEDLSIEAPEGSYAYEWAAGKGYQVQNP